MIMSKITAAEARELAGPTVEERVDEVYPLIREAAQQGKRSLALTSKFWTHCGYQGTPDWREACELLRADGFEVKFFYEEQQFVNMYTIVKW